MHLFIYLSSICGAPRWTVTLAFAYTGWTTGRPWLTDSLLNSQDGFNSQLNIPYTNIAITMAFFLQISLNLLW